MTKIHSLLILIFIIIILFQYLSESGNAVFVLFLSDSVIDSYSKQGSYHKNKTKEFGHKSHVAKKLKVLVTTYFSFRITNISTCTNIN